MASDSTAKTTKLKQLTQRHNLILMASAAGVFLVTVAIIVGGVLFIRRNSTASSITAADYTAITAGIQFTDAAQPTFVYQSPTFNFQQTIDTTRYNYYETSSGLSEYSKATNDSTNFAISVLKQTGDTPFDLAKEVASYKQVVSS